MSIAPYRDTNEAHDHTYYGNGCNNSWGTSGEGGSKTPCPISNAGGRIVKDGNNQDQKNGTYYTFQASTSGSGATLSIGDMNAPDTFCPLGWQLPYSGTGGDYYNKPKSWKYLLKTYNITFDTGTPADAIKVQSYPFSYVYSGYYYWATGRLYRQTGIGYNWSQTIHNDTGAYHLELSNTAIKTANPNAKHYGFDLRCDFDISNLKSSPWHPRSLISIMAFHFLKAHFPSVKIMSNYLKNETKYFIF